MGGQFGMLLRGLACAGLIGVALAVSAGISPAEAAHYSKKVLAGLTPAERQELEDYEAVRDVFDDKADRYWAVATSKRRERQAKKRAGATLTLDDYVTEHPPIYKGPELSKALAAKLAKLVKALDPKSEAAKPAPLPGLPEILTAAEQVYGFTPEQVAESAFRRRFVAEALAAGLTKDQVVRVYTLETSGNGTYGQISGTHPVTGKGKPISSAIGYVQLLHANSIGTLASHGRKLITRLAKRAETADADERRHINGKITVLRRMMKDAKAAGETWAEQYKFGGTAIGLAIHSLNLDIDTGPWLQVFKLNELRILAEKKGFAKVTGAQLEMMNLAGPASGLEMLAPLTRDLPTSNFFERGGYERNGVVRGRTAGQLLAEMNKRIDHWIKEPGAQELNALFDQLARQ